MKPSDLLAWLNERWKTHRGIANDSCPDAGCQEFAFTFGFVTNALERMVAARPAPPHHLRIEEIERELASMRGLLQIERREHGEAQETVDRLRKDNAALCGHIDTLKAERDILRKRVESLREALAYLARWGDEKARQVAVGARMADEKVDKAGTVPT